MIPDEAVEAAAFTVGEAVYGDLTPKEAARQILEAAAPHLCNCRSAGGRGMRGLRRFVCLLIGHDYTVFFRCLRCETPPE